MRDEDASNKLKTQNSQLKTNRFAPVIISIASLIITFLVSISKLEFLPKVLVFLTISIICGIVIYFLQNRQIEKPPEETDYDHSQDMPENIFSREVEEKLLALEEANTIFGATLKPADMFRLVSSRISEIMSFSTCVMFLAFEDEEKLKAVYASGKYSPYFSDIEIHGNIGMVGDTFKKRRGQTDNNLKVERSIVSIEALQNLKAGIACPLLSDGQSYGVLALYSDQEEAYDAKSIKLIEAIGERLSPLFINSITFERSLNTALIDSLTRLPNERALFFVLENQIAESQRLREQRPLTVLSIDIQGFTALNKSYGHVTGDRILNFAAENIKSQLRQMDVLSRVIGDEFLAVLPTSSGKTTEIIIERIERTFEALPFVTAENEKISIKLHFGSASFLTDGETANDLLKIAKVRKQESKSPVKSTVLWFPKEYSN